MTAPTHSPVEVAHAHMIVNSHRVMTDAGLIYPDELLDAAEVLAAEVHRLLLEAALNAANTEPRNWTASAFWAVYCAALLIGVWEVFVWLAGTWAP